MSIKISELPDYDISNINNDDFVPIVQDGVTKKVTKETMMEARTMREGGMSNPPTAAELQAIIGIPEHDAAYIVKDTSGGGGMYLIVYADNAWFRRKLVETS